LIILLGACTSTYKESNECAVFTQLKSYKPPFSGLIYLYDDLESHLLSTLDAETQKDTFCWYANGDNIIGASQKIMKGWSKQYLFELVNGDWVLKEEKEVLHWPAHE